MDKKDVSNPHLSHLQALALPFTGTSNVRAHAMGYYTIYHYRYIYNTPYVNA